MEHYYSWSRPFVKWLDRVLLIISIFVLISVILRFGFYLTSFWLGLLLKFNIFIVIFFLLQFFFKIIVSIDKSFYLKKHWFESIFVFFIIFETILFIRVFGFNKNQIDFFDFKVRNLTDLYILITQPFIILSYIPGLIRFNWNISNIKIHPSKLLLLTFFFIIIIGTMLLLMPKSVNQEYKLSIIDALFTSTSAVCVTGLIVVDTAKVYSPIGQVIILLLIQIGGLGLMSFTSFFRIFFREGIGIQDRLILQDMMSTENIGIITNTLKNIIIMVFTIELIGAVMLFSSWVNEGWTLKKLIFTSAFHSVSAFCNAGFSLFSDNLISYKSNVMVNLTICCLIIFGGMGFIVLADLKDGFFYMITKKRVPRLKLQTKIVLLMTFILILLGFVAFILLETNNFKLGTKDTLLAAFFTSVTTRTAGFNTIDIAAIGVPMTLILIILMFIGASPGSTGGGIKTVTFAVLWTSISYILLNKRIVIHKKNIPFIVLNRSIIIFTLALSLIFIISFALSITEKTGILDIIFESVSAFGTVGLSRGLTNSLTFAGKILIIISMYIGRVGLLSLVMSVTNSQRSKIRCEYPSEIVAVG